MNRQNPVLFEMIPVGSVAFLVSKWTGITLLASTRASNSCG
jgi:hypothetical protein